jgi:uncharacterized SAM-binding protein YcdF (DUF218 family)
MEFTLKKIIGFFVEPLGFVLFLFFISTIFMLGGKEKRSKQFAFFGLFFLLLFSYQPFSNTLLAHLENSYQQYDYNNSAKYIHVLGSGHTVDPAQPISSQVGNSGVKRVIEGIAIHLRTPNSKLIFTGYKADTNTSIVEMNTKLALSLGVKKENIIAGCEAKDTQEEAECVKEIVKNEKLILVTSASHMPRAMKIFNTVELNPIPAPTDFRKEPQNRYATPPKIGYLKDSEVAIHEYIGMAWSILSSAANKIK